MFTEYISSTPDTGPIHICYLPAGRSVLGKTVPEVLAEGTVFPNMD